jgi:hypothetical protein
MRLNPTPPVNTTATQVNCVRPTTGREGSLYVPARHVDSILSMMEAYQALLHKGVPKATHMPTRAIKALAVNYNSDPQLKLPDDNRVSLFVANVEAFGQHMKQSIGNGFYQVDLNLHDIPSLNSLEDKKNTQAMRAVEGYVEAAVSNQATQQGVPHHYIAGKQPVHTLPTSASRWMDTYTKQTPARRFVINTDK